MRIDGPPARPRPACCALRAAPAGPPGADLAPPVVAESGDPFTRCRVIDLLARIERGRPIRIADSSIG